MGWPPSPEPDERDVVWPDPQDDPDEERSHRAARIADRGRGLERGDFLDEEDDDAADP